MTKTELLDKLAELAQRWKDGELVDPYDTGPCTDIARIYVSKCADELRKLIAGED